MPVFNEQSNFYNNRLLDYILFDLGLIQKQNAPVYDRMINLISLVLFYVKSLIILRTYVMATREWRLLDSGHDVTTDIW